MVKICRTLLQGRRVILAINRDFLLSCTTDRSNKTASGVPKLVQQIDEVARLLAEGLKYDTIPHAAHTVMGIARWLERWSENSRARYSPGQVVVAQLGPFMYQPETDQEHPCVVLFEDQNWALVAPITSKKTPDGVTLLPIRLDVDSAIMLRQIRSISKTRIIGLWKDSSGETLDNIDLEPIFLGITRVFLNLEKPKLVPKRKVDKQY